MRNPFRRKNQPPVPVDRPTRPSISVKTEVPRPILPSASPSPESSSATGFGKRQPVSPDERPTTPSSSHPSHGTSIFSTPSSPVTATPPTSVYISPTSSRHPGQRQPWSPNAETSLSGALWRVDNYDEEDESNSDATSIVHSSGVMHLAPEVDVTDLIKRCTIGRSNAAQLSSQLQEVAEHPDIRRLYLECQMSREQIAARLLHIPETSESPGEKSELGTSKPYKAKSLACLRAELLDADRELLEVTRTYEGLVRQRTGGQISAIEPAISDTQAHEPSPPSVRDRHPSPDHPMLRPPPTYHDVIRPEVAYTADWKPIVLTDLADQACERLWDPLANIYDWLEVAEDSRKHGQISEERGHLTEAFIRYSRSVAIVIQYLPTHADHEAILTLDQRCNLAKHGHDLVVSLGKVGGIISKRNHEWTCRRSLRPDFWPSRPKSNGATFPWLMFSLLPPGEDSQATADVLEAITAFLQPHITKESRNAQAALALQGDLAQYMLDGLQKWLDYYEVHACRRDAIYLLVRLATRSSILPQSLFIQDVCIGESRDPWAYGGLADIFRAKLGEQEVAVKRLRVNERGPVRAEIHRSLCKEALIWHQLRHPNVLLLLGIDANTFANTDALCMVSPWMRRGTIMEYIQTNDFHATTDREGLLLDIAEGLTYLHSQKIVHGDLHGSNIFITEDRRACLADFGLTVVGDITLGRITTTTHNNRGATQWLSPDLLTDESSGQKNAATDVYGFGLLCLATSTKTLPWHPLKDPAVLLALMSGRHPTRPSIEMCHGHPMSPQLWALAERCWAHDPSARPTMHDVVSLMRRWPMPRTNNAALWPSYTPIVQRCSTDDFPVSPFLASTSISDSTSTSVDAGGAAYSWLSDRKDARANMRTVNAWHVHPPSPASTRAGSDARPASSVRTSIDAASARRQHEEVNVTRIAELVAQRLQPNAPESPPVDVNHFLELIAQRIDRPSATAPDEPPPSYEG